jgi:Predicted dinucleotide-binding enzymes
MKIGILGSGVVAQTLGTGFLKNGHEVRLGTRDAPKLAEWQEKAGENASVGSFEDAAKFGDVVVVAVGGTVAVSAVEQAGVVNFDGKTTIDVTNALDFSTGAPKFAVIGGDSVAAQIQKAAPKANVVKAFNMISSTVMMDPKFGDEAATLFIAGDSDKAKAATTKLAEEFGWDVADFGGVDQAYYLEAFAFGFISYAFKSNDWARGFRFLKKGD